ncbi:MAG: ATP synthase F1 subunit gamma [Muribaculaceae bacterium]|nr:ATP synthase F1 subunit gamma [Muribaculaceae bacterium]MDE6027452.1 ATP synthase F1 subunit gamma [Muribaculaceae bacterium]
MATLRELKTRIGSVASSEKITGAMKMISSAKVRQNEQALKKLAPFKEQIQSIMGHILSTDQNFNSPLIEPREVSHASIVVFGSDDGLCGAYNLNIFKGFLVALNKIKQTHGKDVKITVYPVGSKIAKAVRRLESDELDIVVPSGIDSKMEGKKVTEFTHALRDSFIGKETDLVEVVFMKYISMGKQVLNTEQLFPVLADKLLAKESREEENQLYIFEPDPNSIFNEVLPMFVTSTMQEITVENRASEQAARVMAMQAANDNAKKLFEELQIEYNKLRQESITTELLDILGGQVER